MNPFKYITKSICFVLLNLFILSGSIFANNNLFPEYKVNKYLGPINLKLYISRYDFASDRELPFRNNYVFVNTIRNSDEGGRVSGFYKTDIDGAIYVSMSTHAKGAEITVYKINKSNSSINLGCKLASVDGIYQNSFTIPYVDSDSYEKNYFMLKGNC